MLCPNCGTNLNETATRCEYCGTDLMMDSSGIENKYNKSQDTFQRSQESLYANGGNRNKSGKVLAAIVIIAIGVVVCSLLYKSYQLNEKYSGLKDHYGLSNQEIENNISNYYYRKWYSSFGGTFTLTKDKIIGNNGNDKSLDYKITNIYRKEDNDVFTITIFSNDLYVKLAPYIKTDINGNKEYDYVYFYYGGSDGNFSNAEYEILYDRPTNEIDINR